MRMQDHLPSSLRAPGLFFVSAAALLLSSAFVLSSVLTIMDASMESSVNSEDADIVTRLLADNPVIVRSEERFSGRSIFYIPRAPRVPAPPPPPRVVVEERPPEPPPPPPPPRIPTTYGGPAITGILGKDVFFANNKRIPEGMESEGVTVLIVRGPFNVKLGWQGGEFEIDLFTKELPDYFSEPPFSDGSSSDIFATTAGSDSGVRSTSTSSVSRPQAPSGSSSRSARDMANERSEQLSRERGQDAEIPEPLDQEALGDMSRMDAIRAMTKINSALRRQDLDAETKERLQADRKQLESRIRSASQNQ